MAANLFGALASCAEYAIDIIREKSIIKAASVVMAMHVDDVGCALNITSLFYSVVYHGFLDDVKNTRGVVQGILKALEKHADVPPFVERATAVLYECGIDSKDALLEKALIQSPKSPILLKYKK